MDKKHYSKQDISAFEAISEAQKIAFAPMLFQASLALRDFGILQALDETKNGLTLTELTAKIDASTYAISVLLDMGLSGRIIYLEEDRYLLSKIGYYLLHDEMTRINMNFTQDICYQGLYSLQDSLINRKPEGLKVFGQWDTIYPALSSLPQKAQNSWFAYDHFYSDAAFNEALATILTFNPIEIYDIGGNTGRWAITCCTQSPNVNVTILDLPEQIALAKNNIAKHQLEDRIKTFPINILDATDLPKGADIWWMSQFLDCFSEAEIIQILRLIRSVIAPDAKVAILETFWNRQRYEAASYSLNASSLYFTTMANGTSRFYHSENFIGYIEKAGFKITLQKDHIGTGHTLLICEPA